MWWNILQLILTLLWTSITGTFSICEKELIICEGRPPKTINCVDSVIRIIYASFGRHDITTCADPRIHTTNCHAGSSLGIVNGKCNGKSSCSLTASNGVFGDPCGGTYKYLFVSYICEKQDVVTCTNETSYINSSGLLNAVSGYTVNETLHYTCDHILTSGNLVRRCQCNLTWSGEEPKCEITCTGDLNAINSSGLLTTLTGLTVNETLTYTCDHTVTSGDLERQCQSNGSWSGEEPNCTEITCTGDLIAINSSGLLTTITGLTVNETLNYTCDHTLTSGDLERQCQSNGSWSGEEPVCIEVTCSNDTNLINSSGALIDIQGVSVNQTLTYKCDGDVISGNLERLCQDNGTWSGEEPECDCWCPCRKGITDSEFKEILQELQIDRKRTTRVIRSKTSANDKRPSSKAIGGVGICIFVIVLSVIVGLDLRRLYKEFKLMIRNVTSRCKKHK